MLTAEDIKELQEDLRVGSILTAKLTDQCRELENQLAKRDKPVCPNCQGSGMYAEAGYIGTDVVTCTACKGTGE